MSGSAGSTDHSKSPATEGYGLVLAGGSARGGYQIGVWKALRERGIRIDAVVGTSIGAVNGVMVAQDSFESAYRLWQEIDMTRIIQTREQMPVPENLFDRRNLLPLARTLLQDHRFSTEPLRQLLIDHVDEKLLREHAIPYGLMTYSLTEHKPMALFIEHIPEGLVIDYILASSCLPLFKSVHINGHRMIDGSVYNNLPTEMLLSRGYRRIIEVEIGGRGRVRTFDATGLELIHIEPASSLFGAFNLRPEARMERIRLGYEDAHAALDSHFATAPASSGGDGRTAATVGMRPERS